MIFPQRVVPAILAVLCLSTAVAGDILPSEEQFDPRWAPIEKAFEVAKEAHNLTPVKEELRKFFTSESQDIKALGLRWLGYRSEALTVAEMDELSRFFVDLNPTNTLSKGVRAEMANRHLSEAEADRRAAIYMSAVREGSVSVENGDTIHRASALVRAAADGLPGFKSLIEQYRGEIDARYSTEPYRYSDRLLWMLELRQGAMNRQEAIRLHAQRLAEMRDERFAELMEADAAFRAATRGIMIEACQKPLSGPCLDIATVVLRQTESREKGRGVALPKQQETTRQPDWLEGMQGLTAAARVKISQEKVKAQSKQQP